MSERPDSKVTDAPERRPWQVIESDAGIHVHPISDLRAHLTAVNCWCNPTLDDTIWVHHSADRREAAEVRQ